MRYDQNVRPLLRTVGGMPSRYRNRNERPPSYESVVRSTADSNGLGSGGACELDAPVTEPRLEMISNTKSSKRVRSPISYDAEPISSSSDDDDDDRSKRADIVGTTFRSGSKASSPLPAKPAAKNTRRPAPGKRTRSSAFDIDSKSLDPLSSKESAIPGDSRNSRPARRPLKRQKEETSDEGGPKGRFEAMTDAFRPSRAKGTARYGSKASSAKPTRTGSSQTTGFKRVEGSPITSSPEKARRFVAHSYGSLADSPTASPRKSMKIPERAPEEDLSDLSPARKRPAKLQTARKSRRGAKSPPTRRESSPDQDSPVAAFKMPSMGTIDLSDDLDLQPIDDSPGDLGSDVEDLTILEGYGDKATSADAVCPMCNERVDQELLDKFTKGERMTISQQQQFCQHHQMKSAKETWVKKGYPTIDWARLDTRISKHHGALGDILGGGPSHYGDVFARRVKAGKSKTVLKTKQSLTPGYYGIRGLRQMTENIIKHFSSLLRERAVRDRLISARGFTAYVQSVLVPELTVRLIMEDMDVLEAAARSILQASIGIGELLNEEDGDVVPEEDDSDAESLSSRSTL